MPFPFGTSSPGYRRTAHLLSIMIPFLCLTQPEQTLHLITIRKKIIVAFGFALWILWGSERRKARQKAIAREIIELLCRRPSSATKYFHAGEIYLYTGDILRAQAFRKGLLRGVLQKQQAQ
jgi:hypothetical protein